MENSVELLLLVVFDKFPRRYHYNVVTYYSQTSIIRGTWACYILVSKTADSRGADNRGLTVASND